VSVNPAEQAEPPPAPKSNPQPPTAEQAAQIVNESWRDPDWGALIWTAMTTGARRGELCAIRISAVNLAEGREAIWLQRAVRRDLVAGWAEGDLKSHQQRRIALDPETVAVLREQIERCRARLTALGLKLPANAYLFSGSPVRPTAPPSSRRTASHSDTSEWWLDSASRPPFTSSGTSPRLS